MANLNPFRMSFDRPLSTRERTRAKVAATVLSTSALFLGVASAGMLLNASSDTLAAWSNAKPEPEVRLLALEGENPTGKPCDQQTWPYLEARCLKRAKSASVPRATPKHGLGTGTVALREAPPHETSSQTVSEATGSAPPETTGSAPAQDPAPAAALTAAKGSAIDGAQQRQDVGPQLSPREARRLAREARFRPQRQQREERVRLQQERRAEARRVRDEARRAREERTRVMKRDDRDVRTDASGDKRIVRRWSEYTYDTPSGGARRVIVIRRGSPDDEFFRNMR